jgi:glycosyltransferase
MSLSDTEVDHRKPSVSIITVAFNAAPTIAWCIESVQAQSFPAEHIIIDGGSTDGTLEVVERYRHGVARVVSEPDRGIYDAMNKGIALATGEVIGILNADDFYAGQNVLAKVAAILSDKRIDSCYGDLVYVHQANPAQVTRRWKSVSFLGKSFYWGWMPPHPTFFVRRHVYEKYGTFNLALGSAADYELMLRLLVKHKLIAAYIPEVLVRMRAGGVSSASLRNRLKANRMDRKAWAINGLTPYPWTTAMKPLRKLGQYFARG